MNKSSMFCRSQDTENLKGSFYSEGEEGSILVIEDDVVLNRTITRGLKKLKLKANIYSAYTRAQALKICKSTKPDVVILDLAIDPSNNINSGIQLIPELKSFNNELKIIVLTGHDVENLGVRALEAGANSFNKKPVEISYLYSLVKDALSYTCIKKKFVKSFFIKSEMTSSSPSMKMVLETANFAAHNKQPLLIFGETGTGKGWIAKKIHTLSLDKNKFIRYQPNYAGFDLISSELFGHEKGSFTGANNSRTGLIELADMGTLFIDEVDCLDHRAQVALLETLQEGSYRKLGSNKLCISNFRLISATNLSPEKLLNSTRIRNDFYHRIGHIRLVLPPLRERIEDISFLVKQFLRENNKIKISKISPKALKKLKLYHWPGNIRELHSVVECAACLADFRKKSEITCQEIDIENKTSKTLTSSFHDKVRNFKLELLRNSLKENNFNQSRTAVVLGLDRGTLRRMIRENKEFFEEEKNYY